MRLVSWPHGTYWNTTSNVSDIMGQSDLLFAQFRRDGFCSVIAQAGGDVKLLEVQTVEDGSKQKLDEQHQALEQWLRELQAPVGILASADLRASMVLEACQKLRLRVPEDVAVIGVDNDPLVCDFCDPPLTSISRNDYQVGYEAARLLDQLMDGASPPDKPMRISPAGVVPRRSTDTICVEDPYVSEAIRFMRDHVHEQFGVDEVLNQLPLSRRSLGISFSRLFRAQPVRLFESDPGRSGEAITFRSASLFADENCNRLWIRRSAPFSHCVSAIGFG